MSKLLTEEEIIFGFVHEIARPNNDALHFSYISLKHSITHRGYSLE
ncbi:hypothetical protein VCHA50O407_290010 [Vibrio chagasii]|nr:hypothetical protein EDB46_11478 [Vibrio crassostreae]CAH7186612.1 hypothetical protein VCHA50O407_290010 [Vibrio chagasii]CAK2955188.1 hypothetical protein VCRA217O134_320010 [Vibrio crassostreae]CAK3524806.1 hypothetical protein VCRA2125O343_240010 [Vibrio crassostreae]